MISQIRIRVFNLIGQLREVYAYMRPNDSTFFCSVSFTMWIFFFSYKIKITTSPSDSISIAQVERWKSPLDSFLAQNNGICRNHIQQTYLGISDVAMHSWVGRHLAGFMDAPEKIEILLLKGRGTHGQPFRGWGTLQGTDNSFPLHQNNSLKCKGPENWEFVILSSILTALSMFPLLMP